WETACCPAVGSYSARSDCRWALPALVSARGHSRPSPRPGGRDAGAIQRPPADRAGPPAGLRTGPSRDVAAGRGPTGVRVREAPLDAAVWGEAVHTGVERHPGR